MKMPVSFKVKNRTVNFNYIPVSCASGQQFLGSSEHTKYRTSTSAVAVCSMSSMPLTSRASLCLSLE